MLTNKSSTCTTCSINFEGRRRKQKFCSKRCKDKHWNDKSVDRKRALHYKITEEEFLRLMEINNCECCNKPIPSKTDKRIDHCHETGEVRGILCNNCNGALGFAGDTVEGVQNLLKYILNTTKI